MSADEYYCRHWLKFYSERASSYDRKVRLLATLVGGQRTFHDRLRALLGVVRPAKILDMGCGTGALTIDLARSVGPGSFVYGIDLCPAMIEVASKKNHPPWVVFRLMDARSTDFSEAYFDVVVVVAVLHEMPYEHRAAVLLEAYRLLKEGGKLLIGEHFLSKHFVFAMFQRTLFRMISSRPERSTFKDMCRRGLKNDIVGAGFAPKAIDILPLRFFHLQLATKDG